MRTSHLPPLVEAIIDAPVRLNSSALAARQLAEDISALPLDRLVKTLATINGAGIMVPQWWLRTVVRINSWRNRTSLHRAWHFFLMMVQKRQGPQPFVELVMELRAATIAHILTGRDYEDQNSVGGLSKREMQAVANIVAVAMRENDSPMETYELAASNRKVGAVL